MNISSILSKSNGGQTTINVNNEIKMLQKQKSQLQEQIVKVNENQDLDSKTKKENIKVLKGQIEIIDSEIQQKQTEKMKKSIDPQQSETTAAKENNQNEESINTGIDNSSMYSLIEADVTYSKAEVLNGIKTGFEGRSGVLKQEIALDESRGIDPKAKNAELQNIKASTRGIDKDLGEALQKAGELPKETTMPLDVEKEDEKNASTDGDEIDKSSGNVWIVNVDDKNKKVDVMV